jgi:hypothetical protein
MIKRLPSHPGRRHENLEVRHYLVLTSKVFKVLRTYYSVQILIFAIVDVMGIEISRHAQLKNNYIQIYIIFLNFNDDYIAVDMLITQKYI